VGFKAKKFKKRVHLLSGCIYFPRREANVNRVEAGCTCRRLVGNIRPYPSSDSHKQGKGRNWKSESHIYIKSLITYEEGATYMSCRTCEVSTRSRHFSLHLGSPHTDQNLTATLVTAVSWFQDFFPVNRIRSRRFCWASDQGATLHMVGFT